MRAPALGQARTSCAHLLHKSLNFSSFSKGFTERTLPKRLSLADDPIFNPISSSLMSPSTKILLKEHLSLDFASLSQKNDPFFFPRRFGTAAMSNSSCRHSLNNLASNIPTDQSGLYWSHWEEGENINTGPVRNPLGGKG